MREKAKRRKNVRSFLVIHGIGDFIIFIGFILARGYFCFFLFIMLFKRAERQRLRSLSQPQQPGWAAARFLPADERWEACSSLLLFVFFVMLYFAARSLSTHERSTTKGSDRFAADGDPSLELEFCKAKIQSSFMHSNKRLVIITELPCHFWPCQGANLTDFKANSTFNEIWNVWKREIYQFSGEDRMMSVKSPN